MSKPVKIYTKGGDKGDTSLIGGTRVPKFHPRIEAYGTVDELNAYIGMIRDLNEDRETGSLLLHIQECLFTVESSLAEDPDAKMKFDLPKLSEKDIESLEQAIDLMSENLPELKFFILPGGHPLISWCHIARTVCRRAERHCIRLARAQKVANINIKYLNRLSDYLFILARKYSHDLNIDENHWKSTK
jgi:cob(I)alamin adenosyltransferase